MVNINLYPLTAQTIPRPIPVLPDVGSIMVVSLLTSPFLSAASIMLFAIRSFTDHVGLKNSILA